MSHEDPGSPPRPAASEGVETLTGDPRRAIIRLSVPMIVAMSVQTVYHFVDAIWVSGLGPNAMSAVGFFFPFFFMVMAIGMGLGVGGAAAISRNIGARDKRAADSVASHTMVLILLCTLVTAVPLFVFAEPIFVAIGAGPTTGLALDYAPVMFGGTLVFFFSSVGNAILRAEGDARRAMLAMVLGAVLNIALDPVFIFLLDLGVAGAAWASVVSMGITSALMARWLFVSRDTYVSFSFRGFRFDRAVMRDILRVGLPAAVMHLSMSAMMFMMNLIIVGAGGTDGVAVFMTGWRVVMVALLPLFGIATAVTSVIGAAFGAGEFDRLDAGFTYAVRVGTLIEFPLLVLTWVFAPEIIRVFTWAEGAARISAELVEFLRITCLFYPAVALGVFSSAMFQGTGKGTHALVVTLLRTVLLMPPLAWLLAFPLGLGLPGVWWGVVAANTLGPLVAFAWARAHIRAMKTAPADGGGLVGGRERPADLLP
jgi:putative MATE family efflux protein